MEKHFWHERWRTGQIGFHNSDYHWALDAYWPELAVSLQDTVLVPLCGKSLDMHWLRQQGHPVEGVEIDPLAVQAFFAEWPGPSPVEVRADADGTFSQAEGVCLWNLDFFHFLPAAPRRAFYDRAALIALPPPMRGAYMAHLRRCLELGARGLLVTLEYEQNKKDGPPFSVLVEEVTRFPGFEVQLLERRDVLDQSPRFQDHGVMTLHEAVYRLTAT